MAKISLWIVRLTLGISFFLHGWGKFPYPPERFASWLESIDMIAPMTIATLVAVGEMATGLGIIIGGFISGQIGKSHHSTICTWYLYNNDRSILLGPSRLVYK